MGTAMSAKDISKAWLDFVNESFMIEDGCIGPEVDEVFKNLEESGKLRQTRESWRTITDGLIDRILSSTPDDRHKLLTQTDAMSLALVNDRIQCGTQFLVGFVQNDVKINMEGEAALKEFFRQMLLQKPVS
jgi:hypothetical protein